MSRHALTPCGLVLGISLSLPTAAPAQQAPDTADLPARLDAHVESFARAGAFSGSVVVARDGKPLLSKGYGLANRELGVSNTPDTRFRLGSITKQFTAAAILLLEEQGKLQVTDLVSKHLPGTPDAWRDVTIHHLLTHTSGIPSFTGFPDYQLRMRDHVTVDQLIDRFRDKPLDFEPGAKFDYSNSGYVVLGALIEKLSGQPYGEFLTQKIFQPLGMTSTGYDSEEAIIPNRAAGYHTSGPRAEIVNAAFLDMTIPHAAGALYSTTGDLLLWDAALRDGKILSDASREKMFKPEKGNYAYGWVVTEHFGHPIVGHGGGINGFTTEIMRYTDDKLCVVVLSNFEHASPGRIAQDLAGLVFGKPIEPFNERKVVEVAPEILDRYVGTYQIDEPSMKIKLYREGDTLMGHPEGQAPAQLFPTSETEFFLKVVDARIAFEPIDGGKSHRLLIHQGGRTAKGERIESPPATNPANP